MASKDPPLQIYGLDTETKRVIKQGAKKHGLSESAFCRMVIRAALRDNPELWKDAKVPTDAITGD